MNEPVDHPRHYTQCGVECIDIIEALTPQWRSAGLNPYLMGNALKYLWRAGAKSNASQDVAKARWYLNRQFCGGQPAANPAAPASVADGA